MPDAMLLLGAKVLQVVCKVWLKDEVFAAETSGHVIEAVTNKITDARERRRLNRLFEDLEETVADRVLATLNHEFRAVPENERTAAVLAVARTFDRAGLTETDLFSADLDPLFLQRHVEGTDPNATQDLSADAEVLYRRILADCCAYVVEVSNALPRFEVGVFATILARQSEILSRIRQLLDRLSKFDSAGPSEKFDAAYRQLVTNQADRLEFFGITLSGALQRYVLTAAYVNLRVAADSLQYRSVAEAESHGLATNPTPRTTASASLPIDDALAVTSRLFIRGEAGSGKTTLLQWIAVRSATGDFPATLRAWNGTVPFVVKLRRYAGRELPPPERFVDTFGRHIADQMPKGWVNDRLEDGSALILIDGVDELPEAERESARSWLRELIDAYPSPRYIVSSRPAAAEENWLEPEGFDVAEMQPMSWVEVETFIAHWHAAYKLASTEADASERIRESEAELTNAIRSRRHLRQLATTPLLAALLCALNLDRRMQLPQDRMELYEIALEMLLERRDVERRIAAGSIALARTDKSLILQDLAYWLIRNGRSDASTSRVIAQVQNRLSTMPRITATPTDVLKLLMDRSGLLREPVCGRIDFVHRTFQEYLAARAAVDADDIGVLVEHAGNDQWRQVIVMAAGHAQIRQRNELLRQLLDAGKKSKVNGHALHALAIACLETSPQLDPGLHSEIQAVARNLIPPRSIGQAEALAGAGDLALDILSNRRIQPLRQRVATIRLASLVGGDQAMRVIAECVSAESAVQAEIKRAWNRFDPEEYAKQVLARVPDLYIEISEPGLVATLRHFEPAVLRTRFPNGYGNIRYVEDMQSLWSLFIEDPDLNDISPLRTLQNLSSLVLFRAGKVDLSPLADLPLLEKLDFNYEQATNSRVLGNLERLQQLQIFGLSGDPSDLQWISTARFKLARFGLWNSGEVRDLNTLLGLPPLSSLGFLLLDDCTSLETIAGVEAWSETMNGMFLKARSLRDVSLISALPKLEFLNLSGTPVQDLSFLADMSRLYTLHIGGVDRLPDLAPLRNLPKLKHLFLRGMPSVDLTPLQATENLQIHVRGAKRADVKGVSLLGKGSRVVTL